MIEKNKFKEKILSSHASSADMKVVLLSIFSCQFVCARGQFLKNNNKMGKLIQSPAPIHKSKSINPNLKLMASPNLFKIIPLPSITPSTNNK